MLTFLLAAALATGQAAAPATATAPATPAVDGDAIATAQRKIADRLKDPEAARFRDVTYNAETGVACGQVNTKNSFGGYIGYQDFVVKGDFAVTRNENSISLQPLFDEAWRKCRGGTPTSAPEG